MAHKMRYIGTMQHNRSPFTPLSRRYLPGVLAEIVAMAGQDAAIALAEARGGRKIWIPKKPDAASVLTQIVGLQAACVIADLYGGETIMIPCADVRGTFGRRARIKSYLEDGAYSHAQIAALCDCHQRTVERVAAEMPKNNLQMNFLSQL